MTIEFTQTELTELQPKITVFGVGGAGGNAVNNMVRSQLNGVDFVCANTDAQALALSLADQKIQLGAELTQGLGAGARPEVGRAAAEETMDLIEENLQGCHMAFITAGMGGGTGTGAAPIIAQRAREKGILTVGVVTKPFQFEGSRRMKLAEAGIQELTKYVDTLIIIPNQNLFRIANERTTFADAFAMADEVLHSGVRGITDLMVMPGLVNLDFADVRTVMSEMGKAMMGTGEAEGEGRALEAAEAAISNPLLDEVSMKGAGGVLINITGGMDLTLFEVDEAANRIRSEVDPEANILVGSALSPELDGKIRVSVVATGIDAESQPKVEAPIRTYSFSKQEEAVAEEEIVEEEAPLELVNEVSEETDELLNQLEESITEVREAENAATPELEDRDAPFIGAAPSMPEQRLSDLEHKADPYAEAALQNGPVKKEEPRRRGIFGNILGGRRRDAEVKEPVLKQSELLEDKPAAPGKNPLFAEKLEEETAPLTAGERIVPSSSVSTGDEDHLEIPAFLRRQAN